MMMHFQKVGEIALNRPQTINTIKQATGGGNSIKQAETIIIKSERSIIVPIRG